jgi:hypothetical protein
MEEDTALEPTRRLKLVARRKAPGKEWTGFLDLAKLVREFGTAKVRFWVNTIVAENGRKE